VHTLLIIDLQNDFCDPPGTLSVPGAGEDMQRLAGLSALPVAGLAKWS